MNTKRRPEYRHVRHSGTLGVSQVRPVIESARFEHLRSCLQLGFGKHSRFTSANHSRLEHSLGCWDLTCRITEHLTSANQLDPSLAPAIELFGLVHDIGHGPFSHLLEPLCELDHNQYGRELLAGSLRQAVLDCDVDPELLLDLWDGKHPARALVKHKPFGTDTGDYLRRDAEAVGEAYGDPYTLLLPFLRFDGQTLAVDAAGLPQARTLASCYVHMYINVYFRKSYLVAEMEFQKMLQRWVELTKPRNLYEATEVEILESLRRSSDPLLSKQVARLWSRQHPRSAVVWKCTGTETAEDAIGKPVTVVGVAENVWKRLADWKPSLTALREAEAVLAAQLKLPAEDVLLVTNPAPARFAAPSFEIWNGSVLTNVQDLSPSWAAGTAEVGTTAAAVRLCVPPVMREEVTRASEALSATLLDLAS